MLEGQPRSLTLEQIEPIGLASQVTDFFRNHPGELNEALEETLRNFIGKQMISVGEVTDVFLQAVKDGKAEFYEEDGIIHFFPPLIPESNSQLIQETPELVKA